MLVSKWDGLGWGSTNVCVLLRSWYCKYMYICIIYIYIYVLFYLNRIPQLDPGWLLLQYHSSRNLKNLMPQKPQKGASQVRMGFPGFVLDGSLMIIRTIKVTCCNILNPIFVYPVYSFCNVTELPPKKKHQKHPRLVFASVCCQGSTGGKKEFAMDKRSCFMENKVWKGLIFNLNKEQTLCKIDGREAKSHALACVIPVQTRSLQTKAIIGTLAQDDINFRLARLPSRYGHHWKYEEACSYKDYGSACIQRHWLKKQALKDITKVIETHHHQFLSYAVIQE